ncbi:MAG: hypothetical protein ACRDFB_03710 [Rhabdochlamydiaceae bacterium]
MQTGGWYDNPATGKNQQWNGSSFLPVGQTMNGPLSNGSSSSGGGQSDPVSAVQDMISKYQAAQDAYNAKASDYYKNNPFNYDDMLANAQKQATTTLSPYYNELMDNFKAGINETRTQSLATQNAALKYLQADQDIYTGQQKAQLNEALLSAGQQYSDSGGYDSGSRNRAQGYARVNENYNLQNKNLSTAYQTQQQNLAGNYLRNYQLPLQQTGENLQLGNEESTAINNLTSQNYQNAVSNYNYNAQKTIGAPPGVASTQFMNQTATLLPYVNSNIPGTFQSTTG